MEQGWIKICGYTSALKAEMDRQYLEEHGVPAIVLNKQDSSFKFGRIDLYVNEKMIGQATMLLAQIQSEEEE